MYFPLAQRKLIRGCAAHIKAGLGCGADYVAEYVNLYAPVDGVTYLFGDKDNTGGFWVGLRGDDGKDYQFAHMSDRRAGDRVKAGQIIGITGNTGTITTGPHLHVQIFANGKRIDPEQVFTGAALPTKEDDVTTEDAIRWVYLATQGHFPNDSEFTWAKNHVSNTNFEDFVRIRFKDDLINLAWRASEGTNVPKGEQDFWEQYFREHTDQHPVDALGGAWYTDHVLRKLRVKDEELAAKQAEATAATQRALLAEEGIHRLGAENATLKATTAELEAKAAVLDGQLKACQAQTPQAMTPTDMLVTAIRRLLRIEP